MKLFCSKCGRPKEVEDSAAGAVVTCAGCGNRFAVGGRVRTATSSTWILVIAALFAVAVLVVMGILAAIAIPNFIRFQARSKQSECRTNLKVFVAAERAYFAEHHQYTPVLAELGFAPERGNRYAYFAGPGTQEDRSHAVLVGKPEDTQIGVDLFRFAASPAITDRDVPSMLAGEVAPGLSGTCPDCSMVAVCVGSVDNDATLDVWSVSTAERRSSSGTLIPAGLPFNDVNDVEE